MGHLFSAYHALACLCSSLGISLSAALAHPSRPLADASAAVAAPEQPLLREAVLGAGAAAAAVADAATQPVSVAAAPCATAADSVALAPGVDSDECGPSSSTSCAALAAVCLSSMGGSSSSSSSSALEMDDGEVQHEEQTDEGGVGADGKVADEAGSPEAGVMDGMLQDSAAELTPAPAPGAALPAPGGVQMAAAAHASPCQPGASIHLHSSAAAQPQAEPAIGAALRPFGEAIDELVAAVGDAAQLRAWHFVLEYREVGAALFSCVAPHFACCQE